MKLDTNVRSQASKEISKEKARILGKKSTKPSLFEQEAKKWRNKKRIENFEKQEEMASTEISEKLKKTPDTIVFQENFANKVESYEKQKLSGSSSKPGTQSWVQFNPWKKEEDKEKKRKEIPLNTATVVAIRKKLIALEWARALGKKTGNRRHHDLDQVASSWLKKREEDKIIKQETKRKIEKYKYSLHQTLIVFCNNLKEKKDILLNPDEISKLMEQTFENFGDVFDIDWQENACVILLEPWEEKRNRKISGLNKPMLFRIIIDENLEVKSFEKVSDEEIIKSMKEQILTKPIRKSIEELSSKIENEKQAKQFLEDIFAKIGRLIKLKRTLYGWLAKIETWEEMRLRNIKRGGEPPIITDEIKILWRDGKLEFSQ